ncbi:hypothetical protein F5144DRAFT_609972, partial [Chaetomium tenue]
LNFGVPSIVARPHFRVFHFQDPHSNSTFPPFPALLASSIASFTLIYTPLFLFLFLALDTFIAVHPFSFLNPVVGSQR